MALFALGKDPNTTNTATSTTHGYLIDLKKNGEVDHLRLPGSR
jgi:hypothetical protein